MKLKKYNASLISTLTLITFILPIVGCNKINNRNYCPSSTYTNFVNSFSAIINNDLENEAFSTKGTSFSDFNHFNNLLLKSKKSDSSDMMFYDLSDSKNNVSPYLLKDFSSEGRITFENNQLFFHLKNNKKVSIDKLLFSENFNLTIINNGNVLGGQPQLDFNDLTLFFKLSTIAITDNVFEVEPTIWKNNQISFYSNPVAINNFNIKNDFKIDTKLFDLSKYDFGILDQKNENKMILGSLPPSEKFITWNQDDFKVSPPDTSFYLANTNNIDIYTNENNSITITPHYQKLLFSFNVYDSCSISDQEDAYWNNYIFSMIDVSKNKTINFSFDNPFIMYSSPSD